jgi:hypothetical protein
LVVAAHGPNEAVDAGPDATVNGPRGGEDGLAFADDEVAGGLRLAHEVHRDVFAEIEVEIDFRATVVVCGGLVFPILPSSNSVKLFGEAEHELAALDAVGVDIFQNCAAVGLGDVANRGGGDVGAAG